MLTLLCLSSLAHKFRSGCGWMGLLKSGYATIIAIVQLHLCRNEIMTGNLTKTPQSVSYTETMHSLLVSEVTVFIERHFTPL